MNYTAGDPWPHWQIPMPDYNTGVCPGCGRCHTCGRGGGYYQYPYITWGESTTTGTYVPSTPEQMEDPLGQIPRQKMDPLKEYRKHNPPWNVSGAQFPTVEEIQDALHREWELGLDKDMD